MGGDGSRWIRPRENTVDALVSGMNECDGVELDLRLSKDNRLVLHHDSKTEYGDYPECLTLDELPDYVCLLYTSPSPRDQRGSRMPSSA